LRLPTEKSEDKDNPNAYRDLLIDRVFWKKSATLKPGETPTNLHRFTMTNTSELYLYQKIEVRFDYFDSAYHKISSSTRIINKALGPRAAMLAGEIEDGPVNPAAKTATVKVVKAEANRVVPE
jgi:hypothetical protein